MIRRLIVLAAVLFFSAPSFAGSFIQTIPLPFSIQKDPVVYDYGVYGFTDSNEFVKLNRFGHVRWRQDISAEDISDIQLKFDKVFLLFKTGDLLTLDGDLGFRSWVRRGLNITSIQVHYPHLFYLTSDGKVGSLDFFSGQVRWEHREPDVERLIWLAYSDDLLEVKKSSVYIVDGIDGGKKNKVNAVMDGDILSQSSEYLFFKSGKRTG